MQLQLYKIKTLTDSNQIFSKLQNGTNLPVMESLKKYIVNEIERMNGFSIIIENGTGQVVGHSLLYEWDHIMYFAFFSAKNDDVEMINKLMNEIQRIAKEKKCKSILGPVNLPPIIYGYGFAEAGSEPTIFASAPHNNPIYIELFKQRNYTIWHRVLHFRIPLSPIKLENKWDVHAVDFSKPDEWKKDFVEIQVKTFPPSAQITPNRLPAFNDYMEFIQEFGYEEGVLLAHHEGKAIGAGWATPNPFDLNEKGKCQTLLLFGGAVLPEYQRLGVLKEIVFGFYNSISHIGHTFGEMPIADDNVGSCKMAVSYGGKQVRSHVIMELKL